MSPAPFVRCAICPLRPRAATPSVTPSDSNACAHRLGHLQYRSGVPLRKPLVPLGTTLGGDPVSFRRRLFPSGAIWVASLTYECAVSEARPFPDSTRHVRGSTSLLLFFPSAPMCRPSREPLVLGVRRASGSLPLATFDAAGVACAESVLWIPRPMSRTCSLHASFASRRVMRRGVCAAAAASLQARCTVTLYVDPVRHLLCDISCAISPVRYRAPAEGYFLGWRTSTEWKPCGNMPG